MLPCKHRFHMECIDQWLSARKPLCPICKWDALQPFPPPGADAEAAEAPPGPERPRASPWWPHELGSRLLRCAPSQCRTLRMCRMRYASACMQPGCSSPV